MIICENKVKKMNDGILKTSNSYSICGLRQTYK